MKLNTSLLDTKILVQEKIFTIYEKLYFEETMHGFQIVYTKINAHLNYILH